MRRADVQRDVPAGDGRGPAAPGRRPRLSLPSFISQHHTREWAAPGQRPRPWPRLPLRAHPPLSVLNGRRCPHRGPGPGCRLACARGRGRRSAGAAADRRRAGGLRGRPTWGRRSAPAAMEARRRPLLPSPPVPSPPPSFRDTLVAPSPSFLASEIRDSRAAAAVACSDGSGARALRICARAQEPRGRVARRRQEKTRGRRSASAAMGERRRPRSCPSIDAKFSIVELHNLFIREGSLTPCPPPSSLAPPDGGVCPSPDAPPSPHTITRDFVKHYSMLYGGCPGGRHGLTFGVAAPAFASHHITSAGTRPPASPRRPAPVPSPRPESP